MIHVQNLMVDGGYLGMTPIAVAQNVVGLVIATQQQGAVFFRSSRQGAQVAKVLKHRGRLSPEAGKNIGQSFQNVYDGVQNAHKVAVLEESMDIAELRNDAQSAVAPGEVEVAVRLQTGGAYLWVRGRRACGTAARDAAAVGGEAPPDGR